VEFQTRYRKELSLPA